MGFKWKNDFVYWNNEGTLGASKILDLPIFVYDSAEV
jgi:hypothetical protein